MRSQMPEPKSRSPSLETMLRTHDRRDLRARIHPPIRPIGGRDIVLPPTPTVSPSLTSDVASSSDMTLGRRLRSRPASAARSCPYDGPRPSVRLLSSHCVLWPPGMPDTPLLGDAASGSMAHLVV